MDMKRKQFGPLLKEFRLSRRITLRRFAEMMDIAPSYLSDVENSRKAPFTEKNMEKAIALLGLSREEERELYDADGVSTGTVARDISSYMNSMQMAQLAMRVAEECNATDQDFQDFINRLQSKRGNQNG